MGCSLMPVDYGLATGNQDISRTGHCACCWIVLFMNVMQAAELHSAVTCCDCRSHSKHNKLLDGRCQTGATHHEIRKCYQSTSKARVDVLQKLIVLQLPDLWTTRNLQREPAAGQSHHGRDALGRFKKIQLPMGAKCGKVTCCRLWVQHSSPGCGLFEQFFKVRSREAHLLSVNGWQVHDERLTAVKFRFRKRQQQRGRSRSMTRRRCSSLRLPFP